MEHLHHTHIFASNVDETTAFFTEVLGGRVILDQEMAGARNVFIRVGSGRVHLYDQAPVSRERGLMHHIGIQTDDLEALVERMKASGVVFRKPISDFGSWKYVMAPGPDGLLLELFQVDKDQQPPEMRAYFE